MTPFRKAEDLRIRDLVSLIVPRELKKEIPATESSNETVVDSRNTIKRILKKKDPRLLVVVGPCSIHDPLAAREYAEKLHQLSEEVKKRLFIVMRVYFEKPRTVVGWKGLINDPHLDGSCDIATGLRTARRLLVDITNMGLPTATEVLDPIVPQYIDDLISWAAIGARTTESQTHRELASGLSMPVGYKNSTDGSIEIAINAMKSSCQQHSFLGIDQEGKVCIVQAKGNPYGHIVLRGGGKQSNFDAASIAMTMADLKAAKLDPVVMVDCSHANSSKKHERQEVVWNSIIDQRLAGNKNIIGMMLESNLYEGSQSLSSDLSELKFGVSITDACISWERTEALVRYAYEKLKN